MPFDSAWKVMPEKCVLEASFALGTIACILRKPGKCGEKWQKMMVVQRLSIGQKYLENDNLRSLKWLFFYKLKLPFYGEIDGKWPDNTHYVDARTCWRWSKHLTSGILNKKGRFWHVFYVSPYPAWPGWVWADIKWMRLTSFALSSRFHFKAEFGLRLGWFCQTLEEITSTSKKFEMKRRNVKCSELQWETLQGELLERL